MTIADRRQEWLTNSWYHEFRLILLHACARHTLICPAFCLMPDHFHLLLLGVSQGSDQRLAIRFLRRNVNRTLPDGFRLQHQPFEHVLWPDERECGSFETVAAYIRENPVRAGLATEWAGWPYGGCMLPGYPELDPAESGFWQSFWRIYHKLTEPIVQPNNESSDVTK
jgi:putative transposase